MFLPILYNILLKKDLSSNKSSTVFYQNEDDKLRIHYCNAYIISTNQYPSSFSIVLHETGDISIEYHNIYSYAFMAEYLNAKELKYLIFPDQLYNSGLRAPNGPQIFSYYNKELASKWGTNYPGYYPRLEQFTNQTSIYYCVFPQKLCIIPYIINIKCNKIFIEIAKDQLITLSGDRITCNDTQFYCRFNAESTLLITEAM